MNELFNRFLTQEATPYVRSLILEAITEGQCTSNFSTKTFEFNIFDVELNFLKNTALISSVLDANFELEVSLEEFKYALQGA